MHELYGSERITVKVAANSASKVMITDNFTGANVTLNREAFEQMCREMGKEPEAESKTGEAIINEAMASIE